MSNFSAAQAADPSTPASVLAQIAYERPELRPAVAANPAAYPELLTWLASFNDPQVSAALSARSSGPQIPQRGAPSQSQVPQANQPQAPAQQWSSQATPGDDAGYAPRGRGPEAAYAQQVQAYEQGQASAQAPQGYDQQSHAGGYPGYGDQPHNGAAAPKRRRKGLLVGGIIAAVAVLGIGVLVLVNQLVFSKIKPAASPEEAVTKMIEGVAAKDGLSIYGSLSPAEFDSIKKYMDSTSDALEDTDLSAWGDRFDEIVEELDVSLEGLEVRVDPIEDGLAKVFITDGKMTVDADSTKMSQLLADLGEEITSTEPFAELSVEPYDKEQVFEDFKKDLDEELPYTVSSSDLTTSDGSEAFMMAVEEDGGWFVSPYLTIAEYTSLEFDGFTRGSLPDPSAVQEFDSPEAAAQGMTDALVGFTETGGIDQLVNAMPLAERRVLALYGSDVPDIVGAGEPFSIPVKDFDVLSEKDGWAHLTFKEFRVEGADETGAEAEVTFRGSCIEMTKDSVSDGWCLEDVPLIRDFGVQDLTILAVKEDRGWFVSPSATLTDAWTVIGKKAIDLYLDGKFDDETWIMQQLEELEAFMQQHPVIEGNIDVGPQPFDDPYSGFGDDFGFEEDLNFDL